MLERLLARLRRSRDAAAVDLVLWRRADCPLCDDMKRALERARLSPPVRLTERDVDADPEACERYGLSIPVLELDGRALAKGRVEADELARRYRRRLAERTREAKEGGRAR